MDIMVFDVCALIICVVFFASLLLRRQVDTRANRIMLGFVLATMVAAFADYVNALIANYAPINEKSRMMLYAANFLYFAAHNLILFFYVLYVYASIDIWHIFVKSKYLLGSWLGLLGIDYFILLFNGRLFNVFYISVDVKYVRGPWIYVFYLSSFILAVWGMITIIHYRKLVNKDKLYALSSVIPMVAIGVAVQFINPHALVEMFFITSAILMFMVVVRREENQIDPITGALKYDAGLERILKSFATKKPEMVLLIKITNYNNVRLYLGQNYFNKLNRLFVQKLKDIGKELNLECEIYYLDNGLFAYLIEGIDVELGVETGKKVKAFLSEAVMVEEFTVFPESNLCLIKCPDDISDFSVLYTVGTTFHKTMNPDIDVNVYVDYKEDRNFSIRNEIKDIIDRGLKNNRFKMYYQPIYSTVKKRFVSAEALIRLDDENYGTISPGLFIPMAEAEGTIHDIGDFVIRDVIRFVSENKIKELGLEYIEMNLSASQCIEADLVDKTKMLLEKYDVLPEQISFEITENAADINPGIVDQNIENLHNHGVRIALDDYGTGYSNIKRVTSLPIDQVKLDKSFVDMMDDPQMWIVIQDTIKMLKEMGKEVLVEGVEAEEVAKRFMELDTSLFLGCELIQGFYFCKPLPEEEFITFIKEHHNR